MDLLDIQKPVQQIATTISTVLNVDVEVINLNFVCVAGTGKYANNIGKKITLNHVFQKVIANKLDVLIANPREHELCSLCPDKNFCEECAELCAPIILNDSVIGVFGLIAFDEAQRRILIHRTSELLAFIKQMGAMIVSKINEEEYIKQLRVAREQLVVIMNSVNEGILAIDNMGTVTHANDSAAALINLGFKNIISRPVGEIFPGTPMLDVITTGEGYTNKEVHYPELNKRFLSTARPIVSNHRIIGAVTTFRPIEEVRQLILDYTEQRMDISVNTIIGKNKTMDDLRKKVVQFANSSSTVLIRGESGTGKELIARALHNASSRKDKPFIAINCSAIPDTLLESELFGYEEGAFTGANRRGKPGKFEIADSGTIFLDEIGDMPIHLQAKILRTLQEKVVERLGGHTSLGIDVRIIAATNRPLEKMISQGEFREDLYYRLNVIPLHIPPLRERKEDILPLLDHFSGKYNHLFNKSIKGFSKQALDAMLNYHWPGNVRELENAVEYAFNIETSNYILKESLPIKLRKSENKTVTNTLGTLKNMEKNHIKSALDVFGHSTEGKKQAADALGIGIATLYRKIKEYSL
ncbi:MAG: sigma-54 interaction domain-containing protein [Bacillota bacterium]